MNLATPRHYIPRLAAHLASLPVDAIRECVLTFPQGYAHQLAGHFGGREDAIITSRSDTEIRVECLKAAVTSLFPLSHFGVLESLSIREPWPRELY